MPLACSCFHTTPMPIKKEASVYDFSEALRQLKQGERLCRKGWNGKGIFIELEKPSSDSRMTCPFICIDSTGITNPNPDSQKLRVPWIPGQADLLAEDWQIFTE